MNNKNKGGCKMYKLKSGVSWEDVKEVYSDTGKFTFEDDFEKVELPVVELKENEGNESYIDGPDLS